MGESDWQDSRTEATVSTRPLCGLCAILSHWQDSRTEATLNPPPTRYGSSHNGVAESGFCFVSLIGTRLRHSNGIPEIDILRIECDGLAEGVERPGLISCLGA